MASHYYHLGESLPDCCKGGAVSIGNYDGVHLGHQALLRETAQRAREFQGPAVAVTFYPHPLRVLRPQLFKPMLTTIVHRAELLESYGMDQVIVLVTTPLLLQLGARAFFDHILVCQLDARVVVEGANFGFGNRREGTVDTLQQYCQESGRRLVLVPPVEQEGQPVSSSRVRSELLAGNVKVAARLLGRPFRLLSTVVAGQRRGQTMGFPTANLGEVGTLVPADGVYAVRVHVQGQVWPGAANVGPNPTFGESPRKLEIHVIDFHGDLYGQALMVDFLDKLRDTRAFANAAELQSQLHQDVARARQLASE